MDVGDIILVVAHHYPCALARVTGPYNYIRAPKVELGVWFRHFRKIEVLGYYADIVTHPGKWEKTTMTHTISILRDPDGVSHQLISKWLAELGE